MWALEKYDHDGVDVPSDLAYGVSLARKSWG